ncbi:MAG: hypothetical protein ACFFDK_15510, partial [Promethearchaeota archaeon]
MLKAFFITHGENGTLLYEKVFFLELNDNNLEIFYSFLRALKSFTSEILVDGSKELKSVNLGDYNVKAKNIPDLNLDVILVIDKEDHKISNKIFPPIIEIIRENKEIFLKTDNNLDLFKKFDEQINNLILTSKKTVDAKIL